MVWAGLGGLTGHFWNTISKDEVRKMSDLREADDAGLVIVAVNPPEADVEGLLTSARDVVASTGIGPRRRAGALMPWVPPR